MSMLPEELEAGGMGKQLGSKRPKSRQANPGTMPHPALDDSWDTDNTPRKSDTVNHKRLLSAYDKKMSDAYESGRSGMPADPDFDDDQVAAHQSGVEEAAQPAASAPVSSPSPSPRPTPSTGGPATKLTQQGAPLVLGMIGYCVAVNWVRWGTPGVKAWVTSKFWNTVTPGPWGGSAPASTSAGSGKSTYTTPNVVVKKNVVTPGKNSTTSGIYPHGK